MKRFAALVRIKLLAPKAQSPLASFSPPKVNELPKVTVLFPAIPLLAISKNVFELVVSATSVDSICPPVPANFKAADEPAVVEASKVNEPAVLVKFPAKLKLVALVVPPTVDSSLRNTLLKLPDWL